MHSDKLLKVTEHKNSENRMCPLAKQKSNMANLSNLYPRRMGYFREIYKSQNKNPISLTPKFTLGIIQNKVKSLFTCFQC